MIPPEAITSASPAAPSSTTTVPPMEIVPSKCPATCRSPSPVTSPFIMRPSPRSDGRHRPTGPSLFGAASPKNVPTALHHVMGLNQPESQALPVLASTVMASFPATIHPFDHPATVGASL